MTEQGGRMLRGGARALTGLVVVAAAAAAVVAVGVIELPENRGEPTAVTVDTTQNATRSLVCAGPFAELGADPERPSAVVPIGSAEVTVSGKAAGSTLARPEGGDPPAVFTGPERESLAAAQLQRVDTENLRGLTASACAEPLNEQWLVGGETSAGASTTLSIGNPGTVPATVRITLFDGEGQIDALNTAGVIVNPGSEQTVSLNGYAPDRDRLAVKVESTGAPVTASLGVGRVDGIDPFSIATVTRQAEPRSSLVIPGVANRSDHEAGPSDSGEGDQYGVVVRVLAPGGEIGTARVRALDDEGRSSDLGTIDFLAGGLAELTVQTWPKDAEALVIDADAPIVGAALGSVQHKKQHDNEWFAPAPAILPGAATAVPVVPGGRLVVVNPGPGSAVVRIADATGEDATTETVIPGGSAKVVSAPAQALLKSTLEVHAGVRVLDDGDLAAYPVLSADPRDGSLTVFTR